MNFCTKVRIPDIITYASFGDHRFQVFFWGGRGAEFEFSLSNPLTCAVVLKHSGATVPVCNYQQVCVFLMFSARERRSVERVGRWSRDCWWRHTMLSKHSLSTSQLLLATVCEWVMAAAAAAGCCWWWWWWQWISVEITYSRCPRVEMCCFQWR